MFRGASIYDHEPPLGWRVLVMRYWPRGVRRDRVDTWLRDAAPTVPLLRAYRDNAIGWDTFAERYRQEILSERSHVLEELRALEREHGDVVLLCTERIPPAEHCHRLTLIELLAT
jgi:uncharacterized protein YeaO (DUF488 family)